MLKESLSKNKLPSFYLLTHDRELQKASNTGRLSHQLFPEHCQVVPWARKEPSPVLIHAIKQGDIALVYPEDLSTLEASMEEVRATENVLNESLDKDSHSKDIHCKDRRSIECTLDMESTHLFSAYVLLDGTWQEARKMFNHSPYLNALPRVTIDAGKTSEYTLRRNQKGHGLCTVECIIELLNMHELEHEARSLDCLFREWMANFTLR